MPYLFELDATHRILRILFEGRIADSHLVEFYQISAPPILIRTKPRGAIIDFTPVTQFLVTPETIRKLAAAAPLMPNPNEPRIVVASSPHIFGMARMFQVEGEQTRPSFHVVRTLREACAIFGVPKLKFSPVPEE